MLRLAIALLLIAGVAAIAKAGDDPGQARAKELKDGIKTFRLELNYNGEEDKPFYRLILSVPPIGYDRNNPFYRLAQVSEEQASKIIDQLAGDGFLTKAVDLRKNAKTPPPTMPGYTLTVGNFYEDLGWGLPMLKRLDGLRKVLEGDAAKQMDLLLGRLSGLRQQWEKEAADKPKAGQAGEWKKLYADEQWYKDHKQPEKIFTGTLERHKEPEFSTLMRPHRYKLGDRFLYPGKQHPDLEKLVGQRVEVRGKPYDVELEGQAVSEIWPAAIRATQSAVDSKTITLVEALDAWIDLLEADNVEAAQKQWAKDAAASESMKEWWTNLKDCHKKYDYRKWSEQAKQIGDGTKFKVGGHNYGHMHVDWERTGQGWRIAEVRICQ